MLLDSLFRLPPSSTSPLSSTTNNPINQETLFYGIAHIMIIALIPVICCYFSAVHLGWLIAVDEPLTIDTKSAVIAALLMYILLVSGVVLLALITCLLAKKYQSPTTFNQALELASYASTPLLVGGFAALLANLYVIGGVAIACLGYSIYLLRTAIPILIKMEPHRRDKFSHAVLASGLILLAIIITLLAWLWHLW